MQPQPPVQHIPSRVYVVFTAEIVPQTTETRWHVVWPFTTS